jgi:pimeloyl-ACP methyl ester carboxylesterase
MAVYNEHGHAVGELGVSIKEAFRVNGIGSRLLGLCFFEAQERQISHLYIIYARRNKPMAALCRKFGATLRDDEGEVTASMVVHGKREAEKVVERFIGHGLEVMEKIPASPKGTVILVHGAGGDSWQWRQHFIPYLAEKGYRAMAVSLSSHGRSKSAHNETIDSYIDDVKTLLDEVDCENTILVGHSLGGFVIQKVLEERSVAKAFLLSTIPPGGLDGEQLDNAKKALKHYCGREVLDGAMREFDPIDVSKITTPIVVVGGRFDRVIPMALVEMTAEQFKTTARVMENSGHALMLSPDWEKVAEMIAS